MTWRLEHVDDVECRIDESGVYIVVTQIDPRLDIVATCRVRVDLMTMAGDENIPVISFQGEANAVRHADIGFSTTIGII